MIELAALTVDCADPGSLAEFYAAATGGELLRSDADSAWLGVAGAVWIFRRADGYQPPSWPSPEVPLQMHMEFYVEDVDAAEAELVALGATTAPEQADRARGLVVMLDPAGRPFCICARS
ncbi:VOC family protein [Kitasatospora sp. NPDC002227]|uniref:VOC family protein n=1 Tax=Kitasatospora sp. NPDC002227 TaxID=3154773 RepID=UPI003321BB32